MKVIAVLFIIVLSTKLNEARPQTPPLDGDRSVINEISPAVVEDPVTDTPEPITTTISFTRDGGEPKPTTPTPTVTPPQEAPNPSNFQGRSLTRKSESEEAQYNYGKRLGSIKKYIRVYDDILKKIDEALDLASKKLGLGLVDIGNATRRLPSSSRHEESTTDNSEYRK